MSSTILRPAVEIASQAFPFAGKSAALVVVHDITGRKQAAEAIANYNERLRILHQIDREMIAGQGPAAIAAAALPPLHGVLDPDTPFLQKPFTPQQLTRKVRELLDQK